MSRPEEYLAKSARLLAEAAAATDPDLRAELEWLASSYRLLADHAADEFSLAQRMPGSAATRQQQPQQQQQARLESEE